MNDDTQRLRVYDAQYSTVYVEDRVEGDETIEEEERVGEERIEVEEWVEDWISV